MPFCTCYPRVGCLLDPDLCCSCVGRSSPASRRACTPDPGPVTLARAPPAARCPEAVGTRCPAGHPFTPSARLGMTHRDGQSMRRRTKSTHIAEYLRSQRSGVGFTSSTDRAVLARGCLDPELGIRVAGQPDQRLGARGNPGGGEPVPESIRWPPAVSVPAGEARGVRPGAGSGRALPRPPWPPGSSRLILGHPGRVGPDRRQLGTSTAACATSWPATPRTSKDARPARRIILSTTSMSCPWGEPVAEQTPAWLCRRHPAGQAEGRQVVMTDIAELHAQALDATGRIVDGCGSFGGTG